eukprot:2754327-Amphidinium_carterae.1
MSARTLLPPTFHVRERAHLVRNLAAGPARGFHSCQGLLQFVRQYKSGASTFVTLQCICMAHIISFSASW